jgi:hypothetical protein
MDASVLPCVSILSSLVFGSRPMVSGNPWSWDEPVCAILPHPWLVDDDALDAASTTAQARP